VEVEVCIMSNLGFDVLLKGRNMIRLLEGLWVSLRISLIAVLISIALGLIVGTAMTRKNPVVGIITRLYLETVRIMPQMVLLFIVFFGTTKVLGINLDAEVAAIIVFSFWGTAEMADLVRGAIVSIPAGQREAGMSLGLSEVQIYVFILIPQTLRRLIPLTINLITRMIKTTSLVMMIGVVEVLKVGQQIIEANRTASPNAAFGIYAVVFLLYFILCWSISLLSQRLEKRWA
jgi:polar amino acid transport system permease protein